MYVGQSFITGSYAYGTPGREFDMDLVVFVDRVAYKQLEAFCDSNPSLKLLKLERADDNYNSGSLTPLRFGLLNLICVTDKPRWQCWLDGTRALQKIQPVKREDACEFFKKLRKERDLYKDSK